MRTSRFRWIPTPVDSKLHLTQNWIGLESEALVYSQYTWSILTTQLEDGHFPKMLGIYEDTQSNTTHRAGPFFRKKASHNLPFHRCGYKTKQGISDITFGNYQRIHERRNQHTGITPSKYIFTLPGLAM